MFDELSTPCYVIDEKKLVKNLEILNRVEKESGAHILLAQKAFSAFSLYPLIGKYISGTTASGLYEARLGHEEMGKENHVYAPAYKEEHMKELVKICDHIIFNSFSQYDKHKEACKGVSVGMRINPMYSTQAEHAIYDPCAKGSRLGVISEIFDREVERHGGADCLFGKGGIEGLHMHTLCEQNSDDLVTTFEAAEKLFGKYFDRLSWINLGGGHHITRDDYDIEALIRLVRRIRESYGAEVYLEPGEAIALNAGYLVTEVMDKVENGMEILILDASAACHMPDVLEMPYRPPLKDSFDAGEKPYNYRLSSLTCLAGDVIGDYSFEHEINVGDRLIFEDMAIYSMVKNNTFNGIPLPDIAVMHENGETEVIRHFDYQDFKGRLS